MDPRGRRILVFGDSLTHRGARTAPDGVPALPLANRTGTPGDLLASYLLAAGAAAVRINGRVSRSAVNLWKGNNGENGTAVVAAEASARPDLVIIMLGTNDLGMGATADAAAFQRLRDAFAGYGAEVVAIGPPAFARADLNAKAVTVYQTLARVSGRTDKLRNDHAFDTIDNKGTALGHDWNVTQINFLCFGLIIAFVYQTCNSTQRCFERNVAFATRHFVKTRFVEVITFQI
jgi:lysophospholipase L1-like esterase